MHLQSLDEDELCEALSKFTPGDWDLSIMDTEELIDYGLKNWAVPGYSKDWAHGGPIIDLEWSELTRQRTRMSMQGVSFDDDGVLVGFMRCFVAIKLGDEVEVLDELEN